MAVDYFHRLIVTGPRRQVGALRDGLARTSSRHVGGRTWSEAVPFSFAALYELAPRARRVEREVPYDPYDISVWPITRVGSRQASLRYQLHTRNLELAGFLRPLSRAFPALVFRLSTYCVDGDDIYSYHVARGTVTACLMMHERCEVYWDRARRKFRLSGEDVYDDEEARHYAVEGMREESVDLWIRPARRSGRRRNWFNRPVVRDIETERDLAMIEMAERFSREKARPKKRRRRAKQN
jgi:hypothetical protein